MLVALLLLAASPVFAQEKEKLSAVDLSVRFSLAFKVSDTAAQKLLPAGFEVNPAAAGPTKGANLNITFIDYLMAQEPDGKILPPTPVVAINVPAKKTATGEAAGMVVAGFTAQAAAPGAYFVFAPAKLALSRQSRTDSDGKAVIGETWQIKADDGAAVDVELEFARGTLDRRKVDAKNYSAAKPDFYRIYKTEQAIDVVRSVPGGIDRATKFLIKATGGKLGPLFDGTQQLIGITSVPYYSRSIYIPTI
jgi:hypothetical protein